MSTGSFSLTEEVATRELIWGASLEEVEDTWEMQFQLSYGQHQTLTFTESDEMAPVQLSWWYDRFVAQLKKENEKTKGAGERGEKDRDFRSMIEGMGGPLFGFLGNGQPLS